MVSKSRPPEEFEEYESFVGALEACARERVAECSRIGIVCGVDMAHVGPQFGDEKLTEGMMEEVKASMASLMTMQISIEEFQDEAQSAADETKDDPGITKYTRS